MVEAMQFLAVMSLIGAESVDTKFVQISPVRMGNMERTPDRTRAVLLIHGLRLHPFSNSRAEQANFHEWQHADGVMAKALAKDSDVFAFAYGQTASLDAIAAHSALPAAVRKLKFLGYPEIILVGHSAGGVLARMFVEDYPEAGVTKVIQVCSPNEGSSWAKANFSVVKEQEVFLHSLTKLERQKIVDSRARLKIPENVQFLSVIGTAGAYGDGMVACHCQWPHDLQSQGIPAVRLVTTHFTVLRQRKTIEKVAELTREQHPRWSAEQVRAMRKTILVQP